MMPLVAILSTIDTVARSAAFAPLEILGVERRADRFQRRPQPRPHLAVVLPALDVLAVGLQGRFRTLSQAIPSSKSVNSQNRQTVIVLYHRPRMED